jgi:hypothetical protein
MHQRGVRARKFALADPLKNVAMHLVGMPHDVAFGDNIDTTERERLREMWTAYGRNGRRWLQWIGTELGRDQIDPAVWTDRAVDEVIEDDRGTEVFVISDCRFHNERVGLRQKFLDRYVSFIALRVHRPGVSVNLDHPSESELAGMDDSMFDFVIFNDDSPEHLREEVKRFLTAVQV